MNFWTFKFIALLTAAFFAAAGQRVLAAERSLTDVQITYLVSGVSKFGGPIGIDKNISDFLGITKSNDAPIVLQGMSVKDDDGQQYQINILSGGRGYIFAKLLPSKNLIYLTDKNLQLISPVIKSTGQPPTKMPAGAARDGFRDILVVFARVANEVTQNEKK